MNNLFKLIGDSFFDHKESCYLSTVTIIARAYNISHFLTNVSCTD